MSNSDPAARAEGAAALPGEADDISAAVDAAAADPAPEHVPVVEQREQTVELQRSVRYGRLLVTGAIVGAALLTIASLLFPLGPESEYSMGQIVGFMALIGAAIGLGLGGLLAIMLGAVAKRKHGSGVAIQTDVR